MADRRSPWRALMSTPTGAFGVVISIVLILAVVGAPWIAPYDPVVQDLRAALEGPSSDHLLGTDDTGRDMLSRLLWGGRASLAAAFYAVALSLVIGIPLGLAAGFFGGVIDAVISRSVDLILAIPGLILAISIVGVLGPSLRNAMTAVGIIYLPTVCRLMRAGVLQVRSNAYIDAARTLGYGKTRILVRHVLPNSIQPVMVQVPMLLAMALLAEASLSFLGFGVQPPSPSWGQMLSRGQSTMLRSSWQILPPGFAIVIASVCFAFVSESARRAFDPGARPQPTQ